MRLGTIDNRSYIILMIVVTAFLIFFSPIVVGQDNILVLHSSHQNYAPTEDIQQGIDSVFTDSNPNLYVEYMDSKRFFNKEHFKTLSQLYRNKYNNKSIDLIITVDDNAFNFVKAYNDRLFNNIPVVFCRVNSINNPSQDSGQRYYGINEKVDIKDTIKLAFDLHPDRKQLVAFFANNLSGTINQYLFIQQMQQLDLKKNYSFYQVNNLQEIKQKLDAQREDEIIFLGKVMRKDNNNNTSLSYVVEEIASYNSSPIYSSWSGYLGHGLVGGKIIDGYSEGEEVAKLALDLLEGTTSEELSNSKNSRYVFDYQQLKKYNIDFNNLPSERMIINSSESFYKRNQNIIWIIVSLFIIIIFLIMYIIKYRRMKEKLEIEEERLRSAVQGSRIGIWDWNVKESKLRCSSDFMNKLGYSSNIIENYLFILKKKIHPQDRDEVIDKLTNKLDENDFYQAEYRWKTGDGWKWILDQGEVIKRDDNGNIVRVTGTYQDISLQKDIEYELKRTKEKLENIFAHNNIVFFSFDVESRDIIEISSSCTKVYGYSQQEFNNQSKLLSDVIHPKDRQVIEEKEELLTESQKNHLQLEYRIIKKNGEVRWVEEYTISVKNYAKEIVRLDGIITDITERKEAKEKLKEQAYYDSLTGVYNRHMGLQILEEEKQKLTVENAAICFIDVNNLKTVNDNYGHKEGDRLIKLVAITLEREIRDSDKVIRLGGDEFLIYFPNCNRELAEKIWQRIINKFNLINQKRNKPYQISASHGIVDYQTEDNRSVDKLINIADEKMYEEKQKMKEEGTENY